MRAFRSCFRKTCVGFPYPAVAEEAGRVACSGLGFVDFLEARRRETAAPGCLPRRRPRGSVRAHAWHGHAGGSHGCPAGPAGAPPPAAALPRPAVHAIFVTQQRVAAAPDAIQDDLRCLTLFDLVYAYAVIVQHRHAGEEEEPQTSHALRAARASATVRKAGRQVRLAAFLHCAMRQRLR